MVVRDFGRFWVVGTCTLISFISFSSQIFVIWPWYGSTISLDLLKLLIPFNFFVFMVFWNYRLCVITSPGGVPPGWRPNIGQMDGMEVKRGSHAPRYCKTCEHYKPPRAHHCRQCRTCVVNHCPWIANCVGFHNQGHFIRFLIWVDIATSYHLAMIVFRVMDLVRSYYEEPSVKDMLFMIFNFAACVPVWLCVGMFSLYHLYLAAGNSTTIEGWEKDKVATLVRRGKIREIKYPYNLGFMRNLESVLGPNPLLWIWPQKMQGDGLSFPVNPAAGGESAEEWAGVVAPDQTVSRSSSSHLGHEGVDDRYRPDAQYVWPPQDPTRYRDPNPRLMEGSPFVYGEETLNPALRPTSLRRREHAQQTIKTDDSYSLDPTSDLDYQSQGYNQPDNFYRTHHNSSNIQGTPYQPVNGDESYQYDPQDVNDHSSQSQSSSPEPYLSDYDEHNEGPLVPGERETSRIRRGSEGWEVRPMGVWQGEVGRMKMPWLEEGRYNVYVPNDEEWADGDVSRLPSVLVDGNE
ncbi:palmitoyltransferase PFA4 [Tremella mesenterica]|uniref:Palmitoyltransferase PFA4 n=1 Tax=Tremella mesenterica TaxID=5217 RepID=A0A4Q1BSK7_TREME|nr:palmitoyltransferase PFA4 [Tremella mesenterica]